MWKAIAVSVASWSGFTINMATTVVRIDSFIIKVSQRREIAVPRGAKKGDTVHTATAIEWFMAAQPLLMIICSR